MNIKAKNFMVIMIAGTLLFSGCQTMQDMSPGAKSLITGLAVGGIGKAAGLKTEEAVVLGAATAAITYGVTKYMASQKQKQTAEVNAIRVQKRFEQEEKKIPRYMAVSTLQDKGVQGGESVMIWDTESQAIVGKQVYHIKEVPELYTIIKLDDYETTYVGS